MSEFAFQVFLLVAYAVVWAWVFLVLIRVVQLLYIYLEIRIMMSRLEATDDAFRNALREAKEKEKNNG